MNDCNCPSQAAGSVATAKQADVTYRPQFRTTEDDQGATLQVALPGVRKEDLKLTLHEANLSVEAARTNTVPDGWTQRDGGAPAKYALDIRLGHRFDGTKTEAKLEAGVLTLRVPVREEAKPRQIAVS